MKFFSIPMAFLAITVSATAIPAGNSTATAIPAGNSTAPKTITVMHPETKNLHNLTLDEASWPRDIPCYLEYSQCNLPEWPCCRGDMCASEDHQEPLMECWYHWQHPDDDNYRHPPDHVTGTKPPGMP